VRRPPSERNKGTAARPSRRETVITDKDHKRTLRTVLPPCNQIVECVNVWRKAEDDPTDGAPKNNSVAHRLPPID
jgi:hypothetical protein